MLDCSKFSNKLIRTYIANSNPGAPVLLGCLREQAWRRQRLMFAITIGVTALVALTRLL